MSDEACRAYEEEEAEPGEEGEDTEMAEGEEELELGEHVPPPLFEKEDPPAPTAAEYSHALGLALELEEDIYETDAGGEDVPPDGELLFNGGCLPPLPNE